MENMGSVKMIRPDTFQFNNYVEFLMAILIKDIFPSFVVLYSSFSMCIPVKGCVSLVLPFLPSLSTIHPEPFMNILNPYNIGGHGTG